MTDHTLRSITTDAFAAAVAADAPLVILLPVGKVDRKALASRSTSATKRG
jgi:hypothetical protein